MKHLKIITINLLTFIIMSNLYSQNIQKNIEEIYTKSYEDTIMLMNDIQRVKDISENSKIFLYHFYLFLQDQMLNKSDFIIYFPQNYEDIMRLLYERVELKKLTPEFLYSFRMLGGYALEKDIKAVEKILIVYLHSDGVVAELLSDYIVKLFNVDFELMIYFLNGLEIKDMYKITDCVKIIDKNDKTILIEKIKRYQDTMNKNLDLILERLN